MKKTIAIILLTLMLAGCGHTRATRTVIEHDDGRKETVLTLDRLDSKACFGRDCIQTKNASWVDRVWKIPQLILFQVGPGATPAP